MSYEQTYKATKEDIKRQKRRCWSPPCNRTAWFQDWTGWNWCLVHTYRQIFKRNDIGDWKAVWFDFKKMKVRWPY